MASGISARPTTSPARTSVRSRVSALKAWRKEASTPVGASAGTAGAVGAVGAVCPEEKDLFGETLTYTPLDSGSVLLNVPAHKAYCFSCRLSDKY